jgi:hypothetical protein
MDWADPSLSESGEDTIGDMAADISPALAERALALIAGLGDGAYEFFLRALRDDGTETDVWPEIGGDASWSYLVPEGIAFVAGVRVEPGDTVSGELSVAGC